MSTEKPLSFIKSGMGCCFFIIFTFFLANILLDYFFDLPETYLFKV